MISQRRDFSNLLFDQIDNEHLMYDAFLPKHSSNQSDKIDGTLVDLNWSHFSTVQKVVIVMSLIPILGSFIATCLHANFKNSTKPSISGLVADLSQEKSGGGDVSLEAVYRSQPAEKQIYLRKEDLFSDLSKFYIGSGLAVKHIYQLSKASWNASTPKSPPEKGPKVS